MPCLNAKNWILSNAKVNGHQQTKQSMLAILYTTDYYMHSQMPAKHLNEKFIAEHECQGRKQAVGGVKKIWCNKLNLSL